MQPTLVVGFDLINLLFDCRFRREAYKPQRVPAGPYDSDDAQLGCAFSDVCSETSDLIS